MCLCLPNSCVANCHWTFFSLDSAQLTHINHTYVQIYQQLQSFLRLWVAHVCLPPAALLPRKMVLLRSDPSMFTVWWVCGGGNTRSQVSNQVGNLMCSSFSGKFGMQYFCGGMVETALMVQPFGSSAFSQSR